MPASSSRPVSSAAVPLPPPAWTTVVGRRLDPLLRRRDSSGNAGLIRRRDPDPLSVRVPCAGVAVVAGAVAGAAVVGAKGFGIHGPFGNTVAGSERLRCNQSLWKKVFGGGGWRAVLTTRTRPRRLTVRNQRRRQRRDDDV